MATYEFEWKSQSLRSQHFEIPNETLKMHVIIGLQYCLTYRWILGSIKSIFDFLWSHDP